MQPTSAGIVGPSANRQSKIAAIGTGGMAAVEAHGLPANPNVPTGVQVYTVNQARVGAADAGTARVNERVDTRDHAFAKVTPTLSPEPGKTLENVMGKDDRSVLGTLGDGFASMFSGTKKP